MVSGGMKCVKYILFAFNLILFLCGLALIIAGAVVQTKLSRYFDFFGSSVGGAAVLLIVVGVIIFVIGFFGCCGAYKENYCMVMTFAALLIIVFILEIGAGIGAYVMRDKVEDRLNDSMEDSLKRYNESSKDSWDLLQKDLECCGVQNASDWKQPVPTSCCKVDTGEQTCHQESGDWEDGCLQKLTDWARKNIYAIGGVGIAFAFIQLFGIILACCLARTIKKEYEVV